MDISIRELKKLLNSHNINLIDIRNSNLYNRGTIANAINIPMNELLYNIEKYLNKNSEYYLFCSNGSGSKILSNLLNNIGYKTFNIVGGYNEYILEK